MHTHTQNQLRYPEHGAAVRSIAKPEMPANTSLALSII